MTTVDHQDSGSVVELWRYPVKSMQGEAVDSLRLGPAGTLGDRAYGVVDAETGRLLSAKTVPMLLQASAATVEGVVQISLPDGAVIDPQDRPRCDRLASEWLGRSVTIEPATKVGGASYEMTFDPPNDNAEAYAIPTPLNTLFDLAPLHLLTMTSLATSNNPGDRRWPTRRFRPNIVVSVTAPEDVDPPAYPEDGWVGRSMAIGTAEIAVLMRTVRCAIPLRAQPPHAGEGPLERDVGVYRVLQDNHENHLGVYANVTTPGVVVLGDGARVLADQPR